MDKKSLQTLEFTKVRDRVAGYTSFSAGHALAQALEPTTDLFTAQVWQAQTEEAKQLLGNRDDVTIGGARDVRRAADNAQRGFTLDGSDFLEIRATLVASRTLKRALIKVRDRYPNLADIADLVEEIPGLVDTIGQTIDERGDVLDSASPQLGRIRQQLRIAYGRIQEKLQSLLSSSRNQYLQEPIITMRAGRYVVPLRAEHKGRIKGIVHDQSSSGATLWVEPLNTVELNNNYRSLQIEEQKEIERILAALSREVALHGETLKRVVARMAELDLVFARALYAASTDSVQPELVGWNRPNSTTGHPGSTIWVKGARHPLLDPATVIPTDFMLDRETYIVLITGPNTGGKTVSLKNIGLMVLMAQAGLQVPAIEARLSLFDKVFADIGDEQSIEQSLSTFSAHITNIIRIIDDVDDRSLVVLDELGSGTDPSEGAALAQAITNYLRDKGATTFIATHYPELKIYASQTPGATNASLIFDIETLAPTYEMTIGIPGKSNALAIARRLGLDETILIDAMQLIGTGENDTSSLIDSIYDLRDKISADEAATRLAKRDAEMERRELTERLQAIEAERERILAQARAQAKAELEEVQEEIRRARRQLRDAESLTALKKTSQQFKEAVVQLDKPVEPAVAPARPPARTPIVKLAKGDKVLIKSLKTEGEILNISGNEVEVAIGRLHTRTRLSDLELRQRAEPIEESGVPNTPLTSTVRMELDIRGSRVDEGLATLDQYLDAAALSSLPWVRIIHGKGTGRLRQAIRRALTKNQYVESWSEGQDSEGGAGVTVARLHKQ
jgi:DNA mismatch repair protein MutS2